jgi:uncharacterized protein YjiS (DUF1127 family)
LGRFVSDEDKEKVVSTAALSRNPSKLAAVGHAVARFGAPILRRFHGRTKAGKDRRVLQTAPAHLLADIGLERVEIRTTSGDHEMWVAHRRF